MHTYAGARGRIDISQVSRLDRRRYRVQPKVDGCYAVAHCDDEGRIVELLSRTGRALDSDLVGVRIMPGRCTVMGELEAHTEAGTAAAKAAGYQSLHLFDVLMDAPYQARIDKLWQGQSMLAQESGNLSQRRDRSGRYHDGHGRFSRFCPRDWRRTPIVETLPLAAADELLDRARADVLEGFVVVDMTAPLGRRRAKLKAKPTDDLDCVVVRADARVAVLRTFGREFLCSCKGLDLSPGDTVAVCHNGWYRTGEPRFPRIRRVRTEWQ